MEEWSARRTVTNDPNGCVSIYVHEHKTASGGASVLTLTKTDLNTLNAYIAKTRPLLTKDSSGYVFPNMKRPGEPISQMRFRWFNDKCRELGTYFSEVLPVYSR